MLWYKPIDSLLKETVLHFYQRKHFSSVGNRMGRIEIYSFNLVYLRLFSLFHQTTPTSEEIGYCDEIKVSEIGGTSVTIFKQGKML